MAKQIGHFREYSDVAEHLSVVFSKGSLPIKHRWRNNGLTADFVASYASTFLDSRDSEDPRKLKRIREIKDSVSYVANELLENGLKYHDGRDDGEAGLSLRCEIREDGLILTVSNRASAAAAASLEALANELLERDISELYFEKLERSSAESSGLGLITMIHDYDAQLAWNLNTLSAGTVAISTQAFISLPQEC
jgi:hypothetical protein